MEIFGGIIFLLVIIWGINEAFSLLTGPMGRISSVFSQCLPLPDGPQLLIKGIMSTFLGFRMRFYYRFDLSNGSYNFTRYELQAATANKRPWVANLNSGWGSFYNGTRRDLGLDITLKPSDHLLLGLRAERNDLSLVQGDFFTQLFSLQANYNFSPNVS